MNHEEAQRATTQRLMDDAMRIMKSIIPSSIEDEEMEPHLLMPKTEMHHLYLCDVTVRMSSSLVGNLHLLYAKNMADAYSQAQKFIESLECTIVDSKVTMCPNGFTVMHNFYPPIREVAIGETK